MDALENSLGAMSVFERVFNHFDTRNGPATEEQLAACENSIGRSLPLDLKCFLSSFGWGEGFASTLEDAEYQVLYSPAEISEFQPAELPKHLIVVGSNGGGEWIVANSDAGYGLLPAISDYQEDYIHIASSLDEFLTKSILGRWFID